MDNEICHGCNDELTSKHEIAQGCCAVCFNEGDQILNEAIELHKEVGLVGATALKIQQKYDLSVEAFANLINKMDEIVYQ